jgi:hypothetical protein
VVAVLGSTFDGSYEPVARVCAALDALQRERGWDIPVHIDGASGGVVAPFCDPDLEWDFRLFRVASINTSGHKYGLVYPGVGWIVWRDADAPPQDLVLRVNYLGGQMPTFALNFSRPGGQVVAQYYTFLRLGMNGYRRVQQYCRDVASGLADRIAALGPFRLITDGRQLPVFAFTLAGTGQGYSVFDVSAALREQGWLVPAYTFPADREDLAVLRKLAAPRSEGPTAPSCGLRLPARWASRASFLQPPASPESPVQRTADEDHHGHHDRVPPALRQLGHVLEVHAVDSGDHRGDGGDGHPGGDLAHVLVLGDRQPGQPRLQDRRQ